MVAMKLAPSGMRTCDGCTLCCTLLPIKEIGKHANERCMYQCTGGCTIYHMPGRMPASCFFWNCRWLVNDDTDDQVRPDKSHLVIDILPDFVAMIDKQTGEQTKMEVVQVWCDPQHKNAHRDLRFRQYVMRRAQEGKATIVRFSESEAVTLFAPELSKDHKWHEVWGKVESMKAHQDRAALFEQKK
jgi:hypothetical protein